MGAQKDINRIRELIIGEDIKRFEQKFDTLELQLKKVEEKQNILLQKMKQKSKKNQKRLKLQEDNLDMHIKDIHKEITSVTKKSSEEMKRFKTELIMHLESKLNNLEKINISKKQLAKIFATLSFDLEEKIDTKKHAK